MSWGSASPLSWPRLPPLEGAVLAGRGEERRDRQGRSRGHILAWGPEALLEYRGLGLGAQLPHLKPESKSLCCLYGNTGSQDRQASALSPSGGSWCPEPTWVTILGVSRHLLRLDSFCSSS